MHFDQNFKCFYSFCNLFVFSFYRVGFLVKVSDLLEKTHQICWFSGCDLHLPEGPGLRKPLVILQKTSQNFRNLCILEKFWRFWKSCKFFGFSFYRLSFLSKGNDFHEKIHQICWFSGCDFHLPVKKSSEIYAFWKKSGDFLKILHLFCDQKLL